jgi:hypothetical protein
MRLPTSKLYRAFAELDAFDDERCVRFVRAAQGRWWWRGLRLVGLVVLWVALTFGLSWGLAWVASAILQEGSNWRRAYGPVPELLAQVVCAGVGMVAASLSCLLLRDYLLRRSVKRVLKGSANCWSCGYGLLGLPVSSEQSITCPECGSVSRVDASLVELAGDGGKVTTNSELIAQRPAKTPWWRRPKLVKRLGIAALVLALLPLGWEVHIQRQASRARRHHPAAGALMAHVRSVQPSVAAEADAWSVAVSAAYALDEAERHVRAEFGGAWPRFKVPDDVRKQFEEQGAGAGVAAWLLDEPEMYPDYGSVLGAPRGTVASEARFYNESGEVARKVLESEHVRETIEKLRRLRVGPGGIAAVGGMRAIDLGDKFPVAGIMLPELGPLTRLGRMQSGRAQLAASRGEVDEAISIIEETLVIAQVLGDQAVQYDRQIASSVQSGALVAVGVLLGGRLTPAQIDRLDQLVRERAIRTDITHALEGERLLAVSKVCWVFSSPNRARLGLLSPAFVKFAGTWRGSKYGYVDIFGVWRHMDLGSLDRNLRYVEGMIAHYRAQAVLPSVQRTGLPRALAWEQDHLYLASHIVSNFHWLFKNWDFEREQIESVRVWLALERHRMTHGAYPDSLDEVADALSGPVIEPMSGQPMLYKRIDRASDEFGLPFLLYVAGPDGTDNGGVRATPPKNRAGTVPWRELPSGADYILNDPTR